ncbi:MAG TPA: hypothetical protein K8V91_00390 [[Clostridium] spiroforme]|uniref:Uncharacterized protein n=1 Tax=Thomasclavelia spiroformis TaxID=29348 RepID=A0A921KII4_9FIRM|nr:hypothetical protein [Thomasclavelia spiroformis]
MARNGFNVVETTFLPRAVCFSMQKDTDIENGAIVGKGDLIEGETSIYEAIDDYTDGMYLVANPAWNYEVYKATDRNEENYINKAGIAFRTYRLEKDMKFKVYNIDVDTPFAVGDGVKFEGGKYVKDDGGTPKLKVVAVEDFGFPFCVGSGGTLNGDYGYAVGEVMKKYTIEVVA